MEDKIKQAAEKILEKHISRFDRNPPKEAIINAMIEFAGQSHNQGDGVQRLGKDEIKEWLQKEYPALVINWDLLKDKYGAFSEIVQHAIKVLPTPPQLKGDGGAELKWVNERPEFNKECILLTHIVFRGNHEYNAWQITKIESEDGWYWGLCELSGEEWGDIADLKADHYAIIPEYTESATLTPPVHNSETNP